MFEILMLFGVIVLMLRFWRGTLVCAALLAVFVSVSYMADATQPLMKLLLLYIAMLMTAPSLIGAVLWLFTIFILIGSLIGIHFSIEESCEERRKRKVARLHEGARQEERRKHEVARFHEGARQLITRIPAVLLVGTVKIVLGMLLLTFSLAIMFGVIWLMAQLLPFPGAEGPGVFVAMIYSVIALITFFVPMIYGFHLIKKWDLR